MSTNMLSKAVLIRVGIKTWMFTLFYLGIISNRNLLKMFLEWISPRKSSGEILSGYMQSLWINQYKLESVNPMLIKCPNKNIGILLKNFKLILDTYICENSVWF